LRTLPVHHPCPECGSTDGRTEFDPLPWERRQTPRAYLSTLGMLVTQPDDVAMQLWSLAPLRLRLATHFRRINLTLAAGCLSIVAFVLTLEVLTRSAAAHPLRAALFCLPVQVASILVGLNELTLVRLKSYQVHAVPQADTPHFRALTYYLSAGLAFSPAHLLLLPLSRWFLANFGHPFQALAMHALILLLQLLLLVRVDARLAEQLLDFPKAGSWIGAVLGHPASLIATGGYLFVGPVFAAFFALHVVGA
jgi:hypothetical protein